MTEQLNVPVLIAGGGGAGLTTSMLLSTMNVDSLLVNAWPGTSILPKAHVLNQRTMEIFTDLGVADCIYAVGTPPQNMAYTAWYAGFAGDGPDWGRQIAKLESWGAGGQNPDWVAASSKLPANLPQIRLEPILRRRAEELTPGRVRFNQELVSFTQDEDGVTATIADRGTGECYEVRCQYLVGADCGRTAKGLPIDAVCVGHIAGDLHDPRSAWARLRGHGASGVMLVRPDRFVGWRPRTCERPDRGAQRCPRPHPRSLTAMTWQGIFSAIWHGCQGHFDGFDGHGGGAGPMGHFTSNGGSAPKPPGATLVTRAGERFYGTV